MQKPPILLGPQLLLLSLLFFSSCGLGLQLDCAGAEGRLQELIADDDTDGAIRLLESEADLCVDAECAQHAPPLIKAASKGNVRLVSSLLQKGADYNIQDQNGETALLWAAFKGHVEIVELLLDAGADPHITNKRFVTPLVGAKMLDHKAIIRMLRARSHVQPRRARQR